MPPEFEITREVELPASPEQVWEAVATTAGNAAWMFPNEIDPESDAVKAWDPPRRFAVRTEEGDWFNALEYAIEAREGGTSVLRYAHSGIFVENWDTQYDAVQQHTDFYLHTLGEYLAHFAGRAATYVGEVPGGIQGPPSSATSDGFTRLQRALGLDAGAGEGEAVRLAPRGLEPLRGVLDYLRPNFMGVRTADSLYCFFGRNAFGGSVGMSIHAFGDHVDAARAERQWQQWLQAALA
jgi:hypothetical protein